MARPKSFSHDAVLRLAMECFVNGGYEGTSIDDLVQALNLHRGSLYKAFGSKRGLFLAVLDQYVRCTLPTAIRAATDLRKGAIEELITGSHLDLLLIAAIERGHSDPQVSALVSQAVTHLDDTAGTGSAVDDGGPEQVCAAAILGARLLRRLLPAADETHIQQS